MMDKLSDRCPWCGDDPLYVKYHDEEWGRLASDDHTLFEFLTLESAQAGLAWITILRKREGYREAFHNFDVEKVAAMTEEDVERLMKFDGIVKNRRKIQSAISNAQLFIEIQKEFGSFFNYLRSFFHGDFPLVNHPATMAGYSGDIPGIGRNRQRYEEARLQIFRLNHLLRPSAGHGLRGRPPGGLSLQMNEIP